MRNGTDWQRPILTWEYFRLPFEGGPGSVQVGIVSLDGQPYGATVADRKLLTTRDHAERLAMMAGVQFLAVPYVRALATRANLPRRMARSGLVFITQRKGPHMAALQQEVLFVDDAEKQAEAMVNAIPVDQGLCVESPMGEQLGLWREAEDRFELHFRNSKMLGSLTLTIRAVARFLSIEARRAAALQVVSDAVGKVLGVNLAAPGIAANDSALKN